MQISEHTSTVLKLRAKSLFWCYSAQQLSAFVALLMGLLLIFWAGNLVTLNCDRTNADSSVYVDRTHIICQLTTFGLSGKEVTTIEPLRGAKIDTSDRSSRVMLMTDSDTIPLTRSATSEDGWKKHQHVAQINAFIKNARELSLTIKEDDRWSIYPSGGLFLLVGFSLMLRKEPKSCVFDKNSGQLSLTRQNVFFQSELTEEVLSAVDVVRVIETTGSEGNKSYKINIVLKSGSVISLGSSSRDANAVEVTKTINKFLGIDVTD